MMLIPAKVSKIPRISTNFMTLSEKIKLSKVVIGLPSNKIEVATVILTNLMPLYHVNT